MTEEFTKTTLRRLLVGAAAVLPLAACSRVDRALDVTDPDIISPEATQSPAAAPALRLGALARLNQASSGGESFWMLGGLLADEWRSSDTFVQRNETDQRNVQNTNANVETAYRGLNRAHLAAEVAARALIDASAAGWQAGEMYVIEAYSENLLAEHMCNGIPLSTVTDGVETYGTPQTTTAILTLSIAHADSARALASGTTADDLRVQRAAAVQKARALLNLGRFADAGAAVPAATVPTTFAVLNEHSQTSRTNQVWSLNNSNGRWTVSAGEGGVGINFAGAGDPRLPVCRSSGSTAASSPAGLAVCPAGNVALPFDRATPAPLLIQLVYPVRESSAAWVTGIEARLIEAEAALQAGQTANWLSILNALRTTVTGLAPLTDPGSQAGRVDLLFRERAFWLFSTGHRLGDLRRLVRQYGRAENSVFPNGTFFKGGNYGTDKNFPIPQAEQNNPSAPGNSCIDRNA